MFDLRAVIKTGSIGWRIRYHLRKRLWWSNTYPLNWSSEQACMHALKAYSPLGGKVETAVGCMQQVQPSHYLEGHCTAGPCIPVVIRRSLWKKYCSFTRRSFTIKMVSWTTPVLVINCWRNWSKSDKRTLQSIIVEALGLWTLYWNNFEHMVAMKPSIAAQCMRFRP